jgi:hypothetical protein
MKTNNIGGVSKNVIGDVSSFMAIEAMTTATEYRYDMVVAITTKTSMLLVP